MATKISTILDEIDNGSIALPVFQRGYVWARKQVSELFDSLYKGYPVGSLLIWKTSSPKVQTRGEIPAPATPRQILLDGQQRMTSLYGVIRGREPAFFDGNAQAFQNLRFHLEDEAFEFYQVKMQKDPLWIDVTELYLKGTEGVEPIIESLQNQGIDTSKYLGRLLNLLNIKERDLHVDSVTGEDKTIDIVVDIFDRVNSGGTKLTRGDLALAKICSEWHEARETMKSKLSKWENQGFDFNLDWLLRITNVMITGRALFVHMHKVTTAQVQDGLLRAEKYVDTALNIISNRLGLDHNQVLFARLSFPVMACLLNRQEGILSPEQRDKLLYWYAQVGMWGRYSVSPESTVESDLLVLQDTPTTEDPIDRLLTELRRWRGSLHVEALNFHGATRGNKFYPVLYMMTRIGQARNLYDGVPLRKGAQLDLHHIFPKHQLQKAGHDRKSRNALANFCFLAKETNYKIRRRPPVEYLAEIADKYPRVLESQWIPTDENLWKVDNYEYFLNARKQLLAKAANELLNSLLTDHTKLPKEPGWDLPIEQVTAAPPRPASIADDEEEKLLLDLNEWMKEQKLPSGILGYEIADSVTGEEGAMFDLAWPDGVQSELSEPVAVLIDEDREVLAAAGRNGYRFFTSPAGFKRYINDEILMASNGNGIREIIERGESGTVEFKSSLRMNMHTNDKDGRLEHSVLKTLAGFLNRDGGTLLIGVADDGSPLGIEADKFKSEDSMSLHLTNLVKSRMDPIAMTAIRIDYGTYQDQRIMKVVANPSRIPVFVKDGHTKRFYVRMGPSTDELPADKIHEYIKHRFDQ